MAENSKIEWTDASWTPIRARCWQIQNDGSGKERTGWHCEHVSEGCRNCYAEKMNLRLGTGFEYKPGTLRGRSGYHGGGKDRPELFLDEKMLTAPLRWKKPRMIFVCSMTDLFADFVPGEWIDRVFAVMALAPHHTFQVLTKRAERMREYFTTWSMDGEPDRITEIAADIAWPVRGYRGSAGFYERPLPNVWLGVSTEDQNCANERIPHLLETPAPVRFLSMEPLLGPVDLTRIGNDKRWLNAVTGRLEGHVFEGHPPDSLHVARGLDWVIAGGESGPYARPMHPEWARTLRNQCVAAGVAFFLKQMSRKAPIPDDLLVREFPQ